MTLSIGWGVTYGVSFFGFLFLLVVGEDGEEFMRDRLERRYDVENHNNPIPVKVSKFCAANLSQRFQKFWREFRLPPNFFVFRTFPVGHQ